MNNGFVAVSITNQEACVYYVDQAWRDGVPIRRQEGRELRHQVDRPGVYRVEVSLNVVDRWRPWIFANPIYVRA